MTHAARIHRLDDRPPAPGKCVLYWMQQSQRAEFNPALEYAVEQDGVVVEADEVVGIWGIIDGYIEEAVGSKDNIDTDVLKKQFRELYDDASANLEVL